MRTTTWKINGTQIIASNKHETLIADVFNENEAFNANARLIAAAPELLKAAKKALDATASIINGEEKSRTYWKERNFELAAAILKAEGE